MLKRNRKSGFTLLELLIVVIIVSILPAVALPQFGRMTRRARITEGSSMIGSILTSELLYYNENAVFTTTRANLLVDVPADGAANSNYNYFGAGTAGDNTTANVTVTAVGRNGANGITVTGTMFNNGTKLIGNN